MTVAVESWSIPGARGEPILGLVHRPPAPRGVILIAHGFKGYRDYGMFPALARAMADAGLVAHRFNFSHSGMTDEIDRFARPDLFERDTWNTQVHDLRTVMQGVASGRLDGAGRPLYLFGHSRGGATVLLTAGRHAGHADVPAPSGIVTAAAPSRCSSLSPEQERELLERGWLDSPSARTGQKLRIGRAFLEEQRNDPAAHDLLALAGRIRCPALVVHGGADETVPPSCAEEIAAALGGPVRLLVIPGANHVFDAPNPMPEDAAPSPALARLIDAMTRFVGG